jgi:formylglycine-generating enzyme required for sulfatase activity
LGSTQVNDAGLAAFKDCKKLTYLNLGATWVGNLGLAHFKNCRSLTHLYLYNAANVGDLGVAQFKDCKKLMHLHLGGTQVGDLGLASFANCRDLTYLNLGYTKAGDPGLVHFKDCRKLLHLALSGPDVSDAGLANFKGCQELTELFLHNSPVGDAGLAHAQDDWSLSLLNLSKTKVTPGGIDALKKALPQCKITSDGVVSEPTIRLVYDRQAAEYVLTIGGAFQINGQARDLTSAADLPYEIFRLTRVSLTGNQQLNDAGLDFLKDCRHLTWLDLSGTLVTNDGLERLAGCQKLVYLNVANTKVTQAGVKKLSAALPDCKFQWSDGVIWPKDAPPPAIAPFDAKAAKQHQEAWAKYLGVPVEYTNSIGMKFRLIPPGEFTMGSTKEEIEVGLPYYSWNASMQEAMKSEGPQHKVVLTRSIYLGVHEVTQAQYEKVIGRNPSVFSAGGQKKDAVAGLDTSVSPVDSVSWSDAANFCIELSRLEKFKPCYQRDVEHLTRIAGSGYCLPTEAQWEFACRAGTTTRCWTGDDDGEAKTAARCVSLAPQAVGQLLANAFGLHDVHGNIYERVEDFWSPDYFRQFTTRPAVDPEGPATGDRRPIRGGYFYGQPFDCRSSSRPAARHRPLQCRIVQETPRNLGQAPGVPVNCRAAGRYSNAPALRHQGFGFRVALTVDAVKMAPEKPAEEDTPQR